MFAYCVLTLQACVFALFISAHTIMAALTPKVCFPFLSQTFALTQFFSKIQEVVFG